MIELLAFVAVVVIVIVAIRLGRQDDAPTFTDRTTEPTDRRAGGLSDGLAFARQQTIPQDYAAYQYNIAGINFRRGIADYVGQSTGYLKQQPTNRYDPNAIAIYASDGHHLGYIREYETDDVRALRLRFPIPVSVFIEECYDDDENRRFFVGQVTIKYKKK